MVNNNHTENPDHINDSLFNDTAYIVVDVKWRSNKNLRFLKRILIVNWNPRKGC